MTEPHDRPTVPELLEAVREFLEDDVVPLAEGRAKFHARVAVNVVAIVLRELQLGEAQARAHLERLAALGMASDTELAWAIRSGELDDRLEEVKDTLRSTVEDKLAVANPRYAERDAGRPTD